MLKINQCLLTTLVVAGQVIFASPSHGGEDNAITAPTQSPVDNSVPTSITDVGFSSDGGVFTIEGLGGGNPVSIPAEVIQSINSVTGNNITGVSETNSNSTTTTNADGLKSSGSDNITVCLSEPCVPSGESTKAISLNDLAELMGDDLQNSLDELAAAETIERSATDRPRRFVRRKPLSCLNPAIQAREEVKTKLAESQKFVEQVEQLDPENNIW